MAFPPSIEGGIFLSTRPKLGLPRARQRTMMAKNADPCGREREDKMADQADSYVSGISDAPLLGETIGHALDKAVRRWEAREALVSPSHDVRWTWKEFAERV